MGDELVQCICGGVLLTTEPYITDFIMVAAGAANAYWRSESQPTHQVVVRAHPDNSGRVWVNVRDEPSSSDGWPLDPNEWIKLTIFDMHDLRVLIETSGDKVIIARSD
jgi:hypothetical protein